MDSGNSGSMQSSSGGDEEYDSRSESISAIFNSSGHVGHGHVISNPHLTTPPHHLSLPSSSSSLFDSVSNYLDVFSRSPATSNANSLTHLDMMWPRSVRSEANCTEIGNIMGLSSSTQPIFGAQGPSRGSLPSSSSQLPAAPENGARPSAPPSSSSDQANVVRSSKKRSRASRRAPTTVLTTDTTNFRAMVQEFTGIPAPPFSASPFPRSRLDLFNTASTLRSAHLEPPPPYLLRPFAQKVQPPSFLSSAAGAAAVSTSFSSSGLVNTVSSSTNIASTTTSTTPTTATTTTTTTNGFSNSPSTNNYQLLSDIGLPKQSQNLLNMQPNPILTFQSILQSSPLNQPKYPSLAYVPVFGAKSQQGSLTTSSTDSQQLKMGMVLEEFGMNHGHVNPQLSGLPNFVTSDGMSLRSDNNHSGWGDGVGLNDGDHQPNLKSFNGNYSNTQRVNSCKINYTTSSSDFQVEKGPENGSSRGEGMVDSWICSSD
ncbi:PREDICTED: uncharacterized protein DDB_G0271670 [Nelumbo nucifera]|uniref:Uncharacterized protein DDB_G0271670 n=1 Tax=Nelumbo nucifera TaxID=4432 RepID=A0A1U8A2M1_NELNU|nr:PREDICTED: uncharacterized protein DDB_G0271670 [Nelumbo nucifera]